MSASQEWTLPAPPDASVRFLCDRLGKRWRRDDTLGLWWGDIGHGYEDYKTWPELLARGPLTIDSKDGR